MAATNSQVKWKVNGGFLIMITSFMSHDFEIRVILSSNCHNNSKNFYSKKGVLINSSELEACLFIQMKNSAHIGCNHDRKNIIEWVNSLILWSYATINENFVIDYAMYSFRLVKIYELLENLYMILFRYNFSLDKRTCSPTVVTPTIWTVWT